MTSSKDSLVEMKSLPAELESFDAVPKDVALVTGEPAFRSLESRQWPTKRADECQSGDVIVLQDCKELRACTIAKAFLFRTAKRGGSKVRFHALDLTSRKVLNVVFSAHLPRKVDTSAHREHWRVLEFSQGSFKAVRAQGGIKSHSDECTLTMTIGPSAVLSLDESKSHSEECTRTFTMVTGEILSSNNSVCELSGHADDFAQLERAWNEVKGGGMVSVEILVAFGKQWLWQIETSS
jgi:hypothetical protein